MRLPETAGKNQLTISGKFTGNFPLLRKGKWAGGQKAALLKSGGRRPQKGCAIYGAASGREPRGSRAAKRHGGRSPLEQAWRFPGAPSGGGGDGRGAGESPKRAKKEARFFRTGLLSHSRTPRRAERRSARTGLA